MQKSLPRVAAFLLLVLPSWSRADGFSGTWEGQLDGAIATAQLATEGNVVRGIYNVSGYLYEVSFEHTGTSGQGVLRDPQLGGEVPLQASIQGSSLVLNIYAQGRGAAPLQAALTRSDMAAELNIGISHQVGSQSAESSVGASAYAADSLLVTRFGDLTQDAIAAYIEALEFCHQLVGQPLVVDESFATQITSTLVQGFHHLPPQSQESLVNARAIWGQYQQQWPSLDVQTQIAFAREVLALAWGDQAAAQALGLQTGSSRQGTGDSNGFYGLDVDGGSPCYSGTCESTNYGSTINYDDAGGISEY